MQSFKVWLADQHRPVIIQAKTAGRAMRIADDRYADRGGAVRAEKHSGKVQINLANFR